MLKKFISVLIISAILVSSFGVIAFADDEIYPYIDTSITPVSREEFAENYMGQCGISDMSQIPEDDYIFLVRNELGDYGELYRSGGKGRIISAIQLQVIVPLDVEVDYDTTSKAGFLTNPMNLEVLKPLSTREKVFGAFASFNYFRDMFPTEGTSSEPIVTEYFVFTKTENFSGIFKPLLVIYDRLGSNNIIPHRYSIEGSDYEVRYPLLTKVDGVPSNSVTVGDGGDTHIATYMDDDKVLWETYVPSGLEERNLLLKISKKPAPGIKYSFSRWLDFKYNVTYDDVTYYVEYSKEYDPRGDINGDGSINTRDVVMLIRELDMPSPVLTMEQADVDLDGVIDFFDVNYLLEYFAEAREW